MALRKIKGCVHLDQNLELREHKDGGEDTLGNSWHRAWTVLRCKVCGAESKEVLADSRYQAGRDFGKAYEQVTGRQWKTEDDRNMVALLTANPALFWAFPPPQAKYLVDRVPLQAKLQAEIDAAEAERQEAVRALRRAEVKLDKLHAKANRPAKYVGRVHK
jgi:hypothetical protein